MKFLENINNRDKRVNSMINNPGMINFKANPEVGTSDLDGFNFHWPFHADIFFTDEK